MGSIAAPSTRVSSRLGEIDMLDNCRWVILQVELNPLDNAVAAPKLLENIPEITCVRPGNLAYRFRKFKQCLQDSYVEELDKRALGDESTDSCKLGFVGRPKRRCSTGATPFKKFMILIFSEFRFVDYLFQGYRNPIYARKTLHAYNVGQ